MMMPMRIDRHGCARTLLMLAMVRLAVGAASVTDKPVRVPWTTSHVTGSPEPPLPYRLERAFPKVGFTNLVDMQPLPGTNRLVAIEQAGKIYSFVEDDATDKKDLLIDLTTELKGLDKIPDCKGVGNAYSIAFHPKFSDNRYCYVCYVLDAKTRGKVLPLGSRVSRFTVMKADPPRCDPGSEVVMLEWLAGGHNGCTLVFGKDGRLYASTGDAADPSPPDSLNTGQNIGDLLASVLRIDVDGSSNDRNYAVPADNPFVKTPGARPEVWAYGLRNPWRMSFDRLTGDLWAADVGWEAWEMVYRIQRGGNYGWSVTEGPQTVRPDAARGPTPILPPQLSLSHADAASITGGYVYRGKKLPGLVGHYLFGDWETRRLWSAKVEEGGRLAPYRRFADTDKRVVSFCERPDGELYVLTYEEGHAYRIVPNNETASTQKFPTKLSETGLFSSVRDDAPAAGVLPFMPNASQWNDGAIATRLVAIPGTASPRIEDGKQMFPKDTVLVRTFSLDAPDSKRRRIETQVLHFTGLRWNGYSYRWNDDQTDAELVDAAGAEQNFTVADPSAPAGRREKVYHFPSRAQCAACHNSFAEFTLAFTAQQLGQAGASGSDRLSYFRDLRLLPPKSPENRPALAGLSAENAEAAARSYLHVNCSHCHRFGGGGSALIDLRYELPLPQARTVDQPPTLGDFGIKAARIIAPGDPARSVMLYRMAKLGRGRMPHIGSYEVDREGLQLMARWVRQLKAQGSSSDTAAASEARAAEERALQTLRSASGVTPDASKALDQLLSTAGGGLALVLQIDAGGLPPIVRDEAVKRGPEAPLETVRDLFERFLPPEKLADRLGPTINPEKILPLAGDAARGRQVFFGASGAAGNGATALCAQCHRVGNEGTDFGPDLTHIGTKYDRAKLLENILEPSKAIDPNFVTYVARTAKGEDLVGVLVRTGDKELVLKDAQTKKEVHVPLSEVKKLAPQTTSSMPDGLLSALTAQQAADLVEFLQQQR
jgi:putative heme-binding domain-containing protein